MYTNKNNTPLHETNYKTLIPNSVFHATNLTDKHKRFYGYLLQMATNPFRKCDPCFSYAHIAKKLNISVRYAMKLAADLKAMGYIKRVHSKGYKWNWIILDLPAHKALKDNVHSQEMDVIFDEDEFEPISSKPCSERTPGELGEHPRGELGEHPRGELGEHPYILKNKVLKNNKDITLSSKDVSDIPKPSLVKSKKAKPVSYSDYKQDERFMRFYNAYPRHKSPQDAYKAFIQLIRDNDVLLETIIKDIEERLENDSQWQDEQYIPYPATYLRKRVFEDEIFNAEKMRKEREEKRKLENEKRFKLQELANKQREELERMNNRNKVNDASAYKQTFTNNRFLEEMQKMKSSLRM